MGSQNAVLQLFKDALNSHKLELQSLALYSTMSALVVGQLVVWMFFIYKTFPALFSQLDMGELVYEKLSLPVEIISCLYSKHSKLIS